jgi:hypothetical protein
MQVRALRGVCIGVDRHLKPGETAEVDAPLANFLASIGAAERVVDAPPAQSEPVTESPAKPGKKEK